MQPKEISIFMRDQLPRLKQYAESKTEAPDGVDKDEFYGGFVELAQNNIGFSLKTFTGTAAQAYEAITDAIDQMVVGGEIEPPAVMGTMLLREPDSPTSPPSYSYPESPVVVFPTEVGRAGMLVEINGELVGFSITVREGGTAQEAARQIRVYKELVDNYGYKFAPNTKITPTQAAPKVSADKMVRNSEVAPEGTGGQSRSQTFQMGNNNSAGGASAGSNSGGDGGTPDKSNRRPGDTVQTRIGGISFHNADGKRTIKIWPLTGNKIGQYAARNVSFENEANVIVEALRAYGFDLSNIALGTVYGIGGEMVEVVGSKTNSNGYYYKNLSSIVFADKPEDGTNTSGFPF